jgi:hypothetical protein
MLLATHDRMMNAACADTNVARESQALRYTIWMDTGVRYWDAREK